MLPYELTKQEHELLMKAVTSGHLPEEAKRAIAHELRLQCSDASDPFGMARTILQKVGYRLSEIEANLTARDALAEEQLKQPTKQGVLAADEGVKPPAPDAAERASQWMADEQSKRIAKLFADPEPKPKK